jgi:hypothetical protein
VGRPKLAIAPIPARPVVPALPAEPVAPPLPAGPPASELAHAAPNVRNKTSQDRGERIRR